MWGLLTMVTTQKYVSGVVAVIAAGAICAACQNIGESDLFKSTLVAKPAPEPNLQENAPLVIPPPNAALPVPGQKPQAAAVDNPQWPKDSDQAKKQAQANADSQCQNGGSDCKSGFLSRLGL